MASVPTKPKRDDLMAEATALRERIEYSVAGQAEPVVAGFRTSGQWSLYFGSDPVYHFSANGALRRAFLGNDLYRSQGQTLARLTRFHELRLKCNLFRHDLTSCRALAICGSEMTLRLAELKDGH